MKILIIGQIPPPYGGQAMMIKYMLDKKYKHVKLYHVRMSFSKEMNDRGKFSLNKIAHLLKIIFQTIYYKYKFDISTIYYPPSNSPKISIYRDLLFLLTTRYFFTNTIFHFHAAGISEEYVNMNKFEKKLLRLALDGADLTITSSIFNPQDGTFFNSRNNLIIPLGIPEVNLKKEKLNKGKTFEILFIGILNSTKGEGYLLQAVANLLQKGYSNVQLNIAGKFENEEYEKAFFENVKKLNLEKNFNYLSVITGRRKHEAFSRANLFCFPSYFESESFGIVLLEAMQYHLPVIATKWRGIQSVVKDDITGFLIDIKNSVQLSDKIEYLINNPEKRRLMGESGYQEYLKNYTLPIYLNQMETAFLTLKK